MFRIVLVPLLTVLSATAASSKEDPAGMLCDHGGGASLADRASIAIKFHQAIERNLTPLPERQAACVQARYGQIEEEIQAYCEARSTLGHDLATDELDSLDNRLMSLSFDCDREEQERLMGIWEQVAPDACEDLERSIVAYADMYRTSVPGSDAWTKCISSKVGLISPPVVRLCDEGTITLRAATVEIRERLREECPSHSESE